MVEKLLGVAAGAPSGVLLDEGDFAEVLVPHAGEAFAGVTGVAVVAGLGAVFVERGEHVAGGHPVAAASARSDRRDDFDITNPGAAPIIAAEDPLRLTILRGKTVDGNLAGEGRV